MREAVTESHGREPAAVRIGLAPIWSRPPVSGRVGPGRPRCCTGCYVPPRPSEPRRHRCARLRARSSAASFEFPGRDPEVAADAAPLADAAPASRATSSPSTPMRRARRAGPRRRRDRAPAGQVRRHVVGVRGRSRPAAPGATHRRLAATRCADARNARRGVVARCAASRSPWKSPPRGRGGAIGTVRGAGIGGVIGTGAGRAPSPRKLRPVARPTGRADDGAGHRQGDGGRRVIASARSSVVARTTNQGHAGASSHPPPSGRR